MHNYRIVIIALLFVSAQLLLSSPSSAAVVLQYHHVSHTAPKATRISPQLFSQHLYYLRENGYKVVPLYELVHALENRLTLPDHTVAITFDDGYSSVYETAFPLLKEYNYPFTVFINVKPIEQDLSQFVSWDQLNEMAKHGGSISNHSFSHPHLIRKKLNFAGFGSEQTEDEWTHNVLSEIRLSEEVIKEKIGKQKGDAHRLFAYPYGEYNNALKKLLRDNKIVAFGQQSGPVGRGADLQALPRFPFGGSYGDMNDFALKVSSFPMPIDSVLGLDEAENAIHDTVLPLSVVQPSLHLVLKDESINKRVHCYASGQGEMTVNVLEKDLEKASVLRIAPKGPIPVGRSRYNCTALSNQSGRYYWYSHPFIRKIPNGGWYPEP
ncbi:MAG: polysaccharide deacetylase family protein [Cellvibrionaceae bacterium]